MTTEATHRAIEATFADRGRRGDRRRSCRMVRDVGRAEELAQDALVAGARDAGRPTACPTTRAPG